VPGCSALCTIPTGFTRFACTVVPLYRGRRPFVFIPRTARRTTLLDVQPFLKKKLQCRVGGGAHLSGWPPSPLKPVCGFPAPAFTKACLALSQGRDQCNKITSPISPYNFVLAAFSSHSTAISYGAVTTAAGRSAIQSIEELADVGFAVVSSPPANDWVDLVDVSCVVTGARRRVKLRIWSLKCWMDFSRG